MDGGVPLRSMTYARDSCCWLTRLGGCWVLCSHILCNRPLCRPLFVCLSFRLAIVAVNLQIGRLKVVVVLLNGGGDLLDVGLYRIVYFRDIVVEAGAGDRAGVGVAWAFFALVSTKTSWLSIGHLSAWIR